MSEEEWNKLSTEHQPLQKIGTVFSPWRDDPTYNFKENAFWNKADELRKNEVKNVLRQKAKEQYNDQEKRQKHMKECIENDAFHVNKIWITKDKKTKRVTEEVYKLQYSDWKRGRYIPPETGFGTYDKRGANNPFYGKKHKKKVSE